MYINEGKTKVRKVKAIEINCSYCNNVFLKSKRKITKNNFCCKEHAQLFSRKKIKSKLKPKIIADTHEKNSLIISELHSNKDVELEIKSLKIGDYLIGDIIIERKTINDFISSMINKRLIQQLKQLQKYQI